MHEAGTVHRLDRGADRLAVTSDALAQVLQPISVGRRSAALDRLALSVEQVEVETLATEIQTGVQHRNGPPFVYQGRAEHHSAGGPSSWHSLPSSDEAGSAGKRGNSRARKGPARRRKRPKTSDRAWTRVPALVFPQCSLAHGAPPAPVGVNSRPVSCDRSTGGRLSVGPRRPSAGDRRRDGSTKPV